MACKVRNVCGVVLILLVFCEKYQCFDNITGAIDTVTLKKVGTSLRYWFAWIAGLLFPLFLVNNRMVK